MIRIEHVIDHSILTSAIPAEGAVVLDCGANQGDFAKWASERFGATVYSFEADPLLAERLPACRGVHWFNVAIAGTDGQMTLRRAGDRCTSGVFNTQAESADTFQVACRSLDSFCAEHSIRHVDLLKLDIEGAELDVLDRASPEFLANVDQITCEFHDFLDASHVPRIQAAIQRLERLGFAVIRMSFWTYGDMIMVNQRTIPLGAAARLRIAVHKYVAGIARRLRRGVTRQ